MTLASVVLSYFHLFDHVVGTPFGLGGDCGFSGCDDCDLLRSRPRSKPRVLFFAVSSLRFFTTVQRSAAECR